jgi:tetratricopeptide (TPR) repeat protein
LGAIMTEILTGRAPIEGKSNFIRLSATLSGHIISPRERLPKLPGDLDFIAVSALSLDKSGRTSSAREFVEQLHCYLRGEEVPGYRYSLSQRFARYLARNPGRIFASLMLLLFAFVCSALYSSLVQKQQQLSVTVGERDRAEEERDEAAKEASRANNILKHFDKARYLVSRGAPRASVVKALDLALEAGGRAHSQLLTAAKIYAQANFHEQQSALLEEAVAKYPPAYEALFSLHLLVLKKERASFYFTKPLVKLVATAVERRDENEFVLYSEAMRLYTDGDKIGALTLYNKIESYTTKFSWMYNDRGFLRGELGDKKGEMLDYNRAIKINPRHFYAYNNRANLLEELGDSKGALANFNKAIEINPHYATSYYNRGDLYKKMGQKQRALDDFDKAIEYNSTFAPAYVNRGSLRKSIGDNEGALSDLRIFLKMQPNHPISAKVRAAVALLEQKTKARGSAPK